MRAVGGSKRLVGLLILGLSVGSSYVYSQEIVATNESELIAKTPKTMNLKQVSLSADPMEITVSVSKLVCREQLSPPSGAAHQPNRDIGFALVLVNLENLQEVPQTVVIQEINIQNSSDGRPQFFSFEPRVISLHPLEHALIDIHLSNPIGYGTQMSMTAIVTYKINGQAYIIQSESVDVDRT